MKKFNLEGALNGMPICTRIGRKAKLIHYSPKIQKGIVLVDYDESPEAKWSQYYVTINALGKCVDKMNNTDNNIYMREQEYTFYTIISPTEFAKSKFITSSLYSTYEEAESYAKSDFPNSPYVIQEIKFKM